MSNKVITVTVNKDQASYEISFDEKALAKLGRDKTTDIMRAIDNHACAYMSYITQRENTKTAKERWEKTKESNYVLTHPAPEFDDDIPF